MPKGRRQLAAEAIELHKQDSIVCPPCKLGGLGSVKHESPQVMERGVKFC